MCTYIHIYVYTHQSMYMYMYIIHFIQLKKSERRQGGNSTLGAEIVVPDFQCSNCIFDGQVNNVPVLKPVVMMVMSNERTCNNQAALKILKKMGICFCVVHCISMYYNDLIFPEFRQFNVCLMLSSFGISRL